jgi:thiamine-monophosphate kinase
MDEKRKSAASEARAEPGAAPIAAMGREWGESDVVQYIARRAKPCRPEVEVGVGDDAAVVRAQGGRRLVVSADMLVEGVHFRREWTSPGGLAVKAVSVNVSDIAAMGAKPFGLLTSVALPAGLPVKWVAQFFRGVVRTARAYQADLLGGDTVGSPGPVVVDVTVLGWAERPVLRQGARPGDRLVVTGSLGAAAAGLWVLERGLSDPDPAVRRVLRRHLRPRARVEAGRILAPVAHAMTDVSDGLAWELKELLESGGMGAQIVAERIPVDRATRFVAELAGADPLEWALYGGEDYELLAALPPDAVEAAGQALGARGLALTAIGVVTADAGLRLERPGGEVPLDVHRFDHFRLDR